jgi:hypothetical protein
MLTIIVGLFFIYYLLLAFFGWWWTVVGIVLYIVLKYNDGEERKGNRAWEWIRKYTWNTSVIYEMSNKSVLLSNGPQAHLITTQSQPRVVGEGGGKQSSTHTSPIRGGEGLSHKGPQAPRGTGTLFVVIGNKTNFVLLSGFGIHGNVWKDYDLLYMIPQYLLYIPFLRDILLWTGAVVQSRELIPQLVGRGKSVAYSPSGMDDLFSDSDEVVRLPDAGFFEFAIEHRLKIVPILIRNESARYKICRTRCQSYFYNSTRLRWPWPLFFCVRVFQQHPPPKVKIFCGVPIDASTHQDPTVLAKHFNGQFETMGYLGEDLQELILKEV